jgi:hypothetical protein
MMLSPEWEDSPYLFSSYTVKYKANPEQEEESIVYTEKNEHLVTVILAANSLIEFAVSIGMTPVFFEVNTDRKFSLFNLGFIYTYQIKITFRKTETNGKK